MGQIKQFLRRFNAVLADQMRGGGPGDPALLDSLTDSCQFELAG
jgi:hypothetical protein